MTLSSRLLRLDLKHTWTISRASVDYHDNIFVYLEHEGITGIGEASFSRRYDESLESLQKVIESAKPMLSHANPLHFVEIGAALQQLCPGQNSAKAALDMALMDWVGKKFGLPLFRLWGLNPDKTPISSFSIGIDTPEMMQRKIREAEEFPILKIKLGTARDEAIMAAVREATDKTLRVDANEGWKSREEALEKICWLAHLRGACNDLGLLRVEAKDQKFSQFKILPDALYGTAYNWVQTIFEDRTGMLWVGTLSGLHKFDPRREKFIAHYYERDGLPGSEAREY